MNYASLLLGGFTILIAAWWFIGARRGYVGPQTYGEVRSEVEQLKGAVDSTAVQEKRRTSQAQP